MLARTDEDAYKSFRNLPGVQLILAGELNAYDILCNDWIVFTRETLPGDDHRASSRRRRRSARAGRRRPVAAVEPTAGAVEAAARPRPTTRATPSADADGGDRSRRATPAPDDRGPSR